MSFFLYGGGRIIYCPSKRSNLPLRSGALTTKKKSHLSCKSRLSTAKYSVQIRLEGATSQRRERKGERRGRIKTSSNHARTEEPMFQRSNDTDGQRAKPRRLTTSIRRCIEFTSKEAVEIVKKARRVINQGSIFDCSPPLQFFLYVCFTHIFPPTRPGSSIIRTVVVSTLLPPLPLSRTL